MVWPNLGQAHRPYVAGRRGAVASAHPLASEAGLRMLRQGGNAIDAIVATAAALNVVEPFMSGAAGVGYMVIKPAGATKPVVLDFIGRAPAGASLDRFSEEGSNDFGILSPLIPGSLAGWLMALERYGTMDRATVFAPAIELAEQGYPVTIKNNLFMSFMRGHLLPWEPSRRAYLHDGETPKVGSILKQPDLARTFRTLVDGGIDAFYRGAIGKEIARFSQENGGLITEEDLASYEPTWEEPISTTYRDYTVYCPPLPCSGVQYLETLNLVEGYDMAGMGQNSAGYIHHLAEAIKLAVADRTTYAPNPASPIDFLLSKEYADQRRALIDSKSAGIQRRRPLHVDQARERGAAGQPREHRPREHDPLRRRRCRRQRGRLHPDPGRAIRLGRGARQHRARAQQLRSLVRPRPAEPERHRAAQEGRDVPGAVADLARRQALPDGRHARILRHHADDAADDAERDGPRATASRRRSRRPASRPAPARSWWSKGGCQPRCSTSCARSVTT